VLDATQDIEKGTDFSVPFSKEYYVHLVLRASLLRRQILKDYS